MIPRFFIDRPIFAAVLSILITITGGVALMSLPIAQYPQITPPSVQVAISYPGASPDIVAQTVAAPVEQQVNGVEGMLYMSSQAGTDGSYTLTVTFDIGTDLNTALVMVQNRVTLAIPQLPSQVQNQGITIRKKTPDLLMIINFFSPDGRYDALYLSNYAEINIQDQLFRVPGVSDINYLGQRAYSMRAWLDPQKLAACNMTPVDVAKAISAQNVQAPAGQLGEPPAPRNQAFEPPLDTLGRLTTPEQFGSIIVKVGQLPSPPARSTGAGTSAAASQAFSPAVPSLPLMVGGMTETQTSMSLAGAGVSGTTTSSATTTSSLPSINSVGVTAPAAAPSLSLGTSATSGAGTSAAAVPIAGAMSGRPATGAVAPLTGGATTGGGANAGGAATIGGAATTAGGATSLGGAATTGMASSSSASGASSSSPSTSSQISASSAAASSGATAGAASVMNTAPTSAALGTTSLTSPEPTAPPSPSQSIVHLRDVARVELGAQNYNQGCTFDGVPSVGLAIHQLPGTNALDVANRIRARMEELRKRFPPSGIDYSIAYDTTPYIRESVADVVRTLVEAVILVGIVVLLFLQSWRAVLIPMIAVPVAIVGTFAVMAALNFSLNNISLFGLVLAIGIVVDDAIVVVENVERWMEHGLPAREATRRAMDEVTGPIVAVGLVLCAVFVPCAFISGITGQFFRQFAVTIAVSTVFSTINSLTLSPALAAILLRPRTAGRDLITRLLDLLFGWLFRPFNWLFAVATGGYAWTVGKLLRINLVILGAYGALLFLTYWVFEKAPTGFIPEQDQGRLIVNVQLPDSASLPRTDEALAEIDAITRKQPGVAHTTTISGLSFLQGVNSSNFGTMMVILDPFEKRRSPELADVAIMAKLRRAWAGKITDAAVAAYRAPPVPGLSVASGFKLMVEDRAGLGLAFLQQHTDALTAKLRSVHGLSSVTSQFRSNTPQLFMDIDRTKVAALGVGQTDVDQTIEMYLGSLYVNSFNIFGRYWQVTVQAESEYRGRVADINLLQVRNASGAMVPLGTVVNVREIGGPVMALRYNLYNAAPITGNVQGNLSSGDAIAVIQNLAQQTLPLTMSTEWTELMFMQIRAGNTAMYVFGFSVICVFLALAALYESWSLPLAVILVVPLCLLCSVVGVIYTHNSVNIFVQIGLVVLLGLACKNAILIVEFAKEMRLQGKDRYEATQEASRLRLRPILMTSFAFILGVVPLVIATGAGAEMRRSLGTAVFSGMLGVTVFGIFLTPVFFYVIQGFSETRLLQSRATRRIASLLLGAAVGFGLGYLAAHLGILRLRWALALGTGLGVLAVLVGIALSGRIPPLPSPGAPDRSENETGGGPQR